MIRIPHAAPHHPRPASPHRASAGGVVQRAGECTLHEARHIQELVRSATASATAGDVDALATSSTASDDHSEETHTPCAWCLTHALEAGLAHAPARQPQLAAEPSAIAQQRADPFTAQQVRWPFAARDPPPAQRA